MKETKFRFWDGQSMLTAGFHVSAPGTVWGWVDHSCKSSFEMKGVLMQFTGLKDINGKEIFEGDLLRGADFPKTLYVGYNIEIASFGACTNRSMALSEMYWFENDILILKDQWEVIGNIYENPELISTDAIKE